jgi:CDP-glucose 4,6-dehydratase
MVTSGVFHGLDVFVTGHTGFKGAWLCMMLERAGARVHGYALAPPEQGVYRSAGVADQMASSLYADIRDLGALKTALARSSAKVVIHMAAQPLVRLSYENPVETYATNVMGSVHLLEAVRHTPSVRAVVMVTSDKCYENKEWLWGYREDEPMGGHDPYSNSKGCSELVTSAYRQSYFSNSDAPRVGSGRAGNVIGGGDWSRDRLVPDLVSTFAKGEETLIRNPNAVRPWQHVMEPLSGYLALAEHLLGAEGQTYGEGWNFGPDASSERTVADVVEAVRAAWGQGARWRLDAGSHPHEANFLKLDSSKAKRRLSWRPVWSFQDAISNTISWYLAAAEGQDMRAFSLQQIESYARAAGAGK